MTEQLDEAIEMMEFLLKRWSDPHHNDARYIEEIEGFINTYYERNME